MFVISEDKVKFLQKGNEVLLFQDIFPQQFCIFIFRQIYSKRYTETVTTIRTETDKVLINGVCDDKASVNVNYERVAAAADETVCMFVKCMCACVWGGGGSDRKVGKWFRVICKERELVQVGR